MQDEAKETDESKIFSENYLPLGNVRFDSQMRFMCEINRMTHIMRRTMLIDQSRRENDAEHSWMLSVMAQLLSEHCVKKVDVFRVMKMVTVHDLIEIYAGDTFAYDAEGNATKAEREKLAADRLFALLPSDQGKEIRALWEEFDAEQTDDARFAASLDSLQPFLHNTLTQGYTWRESHVKKSDVLKRQGIIKETMPSVWPWIEKNLQRGVENGWLIDE